MKKKISEIATPEYSWMADAEWHQKNRNWLEKSARIAVKILVTIRAKGMSQTELADKMGVSRQMISKIVKGKENLTLSTISKLEEVLEIQLGHYGGNDETEDHPLPHPEISGS